MDRAVVVAATVLVGGRDRCCVPRAPRPVAASPRSEDRSAPAAPAAIRPARPSPTLCFVLQLAWPATYDRSGHPQWSSRGGTLFASDRPTRDPGGDGDRTGGGPLGPRVVLAGAVVMTLDGGRSGSAPWLGPARVVHPRIAARRSSTPGTPSPTKPCGPCCSWSWAPSPSSPCRYVADLVRDAGLKTRARATGIYSTAGSGHIYIKPKTPRLNGKASNAPAALTSGSSADSSTAWSSTTPATSTPSSRSGRTPPGTSTDHHGGLGGQTPYDRLKTEEH